MITVGVSRFGASNLKREALLFDKIAIPHLSFIMDVGFRRNPQSRMPPPFWIKDANGKLSCERDYLVIDKELYLDNTPRLKCGHFCGEPLALVEIDWLLEQGIVFEPLPLGPEEAKEIAALLQEHSDIIGATPIIEGSLDSIDVEGANVYYLLGGHFIPFRKDLGPNIHKDLGELSARLFSIIMRLKGQNLSFPVFAMSNHDHIRNIYPEGNFSVAHLILKRLPIPDDNVPWEQILDYRGDPVVMLFRSGLTQWIIKTIKEETTVREAEQEIEYLLHSYERSMAYHKMKYRYGTHSLLIKLPLALAEDLIKLRFGKLTDRFLEYRELRLALLNAELNSPGNEIAYILKTQEQFG